MSEYEFLGLNALLIPLSASQSRGDQIENAKIFTEKKLGLMLEEKDLNLKNCLTNLEKLNTLKSKTAHEANQLNQVFLTHLESVLNSK